MRTPRVLLLACVVVALVVGLCIVWAASEREEVRAWRLVASDDFNGATLDRTKWEPMTGVPGCCPRSLWDPAMVRLGDGHLVLENRPVKGRWKSGGIGGWNWGPGVFSVGRVDARLRFDAGRGVSAAALLWPEGNSSWPPEIDFYELAAVDGARRDLLISNHFVPPGQRDGHGLDQRKHRGDFTDWHEVSVRWEPSRLVVLIDGVKVFDETDEVKIPDVPMWIGFQTHVEPLRGRWPRLAAGQKSIDLEVDWVRVYRR